MEKEADFPLFFSRPLETLPAPISAIPFKFIFAKKNEPSFLANQLLLLVFSLSPSPARLGFWSQRPQPLPSCSCREPEGGSRCPSPRRRSWAPVSSCPVPMLSPVYLHTPSAPVDAVVKAHRQLLPVLCSQVKQGLRAPCAVQGTCFHRPPPFPESLRS